jgi:glycosyltransferase involved in cell wall biosynthesis
VEPVGRNQPCPCGSGKRYKDCHGAIDAFEAVEAAALDPHKDERLRRATQLLRSGDVDAAQALAEELLSQTPQHPGAQQIVGRCESERGRPAAAVRALLRAARALPSFPLSAGEQFAVWSDLNLMFIQALSGIDVMFAAMKRHEYSAWRNTPSLRSVATPLVSVVLVVPGPESWLEQAIASVDAQTYGNLELIVVHGSDDAQFDARLRSVLSDLPFRHRIVAKVGASEAALINAGVGMAEGTFVNLLHARHELHAERIDILVREVAARGVEWGFTGVEFIDIEGQPLGRDAGFRIKRWKEILAAIPQADTVGYALIQQDCVAVDWSNLFFSKALFHGLGGMRELPLTSVWDFCLRAVWFAEPMQVAAPLYRHRVITSDAMASSSKAEFEAAQVPMFHEFYQNACNDEQAAPNPFAPSVHHWRLHFLKAPFQAGHVLMFDIGQLERLAEIILRRRDKRAAELLPGLDILGFAFGELGLGESLRAIAKACLLGGIPFSVRDVDMRLNTRQADRSMEPFLVDEPKYRCALYCLNPDMMKPVRQLMAEAEQAGIYGIGYWYWELAHLPAPWVAELARVNEIWIASEFVADTVRRSTTKPVIKIPPPIEVKLARSYRRSDFGLPEDRFLFLFTFDFNSFPMRKNPEGVVSAFKRAFEGRRSDVGLVMKSTNGSNRSDKLRALQDLVGADDRIIFIDAFFSRDQVFGLESVVDAYVSLHRSEGFGLGLAESMYLGKPVIGTAYSGNLEFMDRDNSCLVDFELIAVRRGEYLYDDARFQWADPDVDQAAHHMRRLVDDTEFRTRIARNGQSAILSRFTSAITAKLIRQRLGELGMV